MATNSNVSATSRRRGPGKPFSRGQSGNPNGRPKVVFEIRDLAREFGPPAIAKLAEMAGLAPGRPAEAEAVRVAALKELLDRGFGKSTQPLSGDAGGQPLAIDFRWADAVQSPTLEPEVLAAAGGAAEFAVVWADDAEAEPG